MKTETIVTIGIWIVVVVVICFFIFMIYEKDYDLYLHTNIKDKQLVKSPYTPSSPKPSVVPMKLFQT